MVGKFAVIGLGIFGRNVALHLTRLDQPVLAIDRNNSLVQEIASEIDAAVCADATDEAALSELGLQEMTCAVVAIGAESTESSILATALLRQMGVPRIVARAISELHGRVLHAVGAHQVMHPEEAMGRRLARQLAQPSVLDRLELGEGAELAEIEIPESWVGKTLVDLDVRRSHGVSVVAIRRGNEVMATVAADETLESGDILVIIGPPRATARVASLA